MCGRHRDEVVPNFAVVESPPNNKDLEDSIKLMSVELGARSHQQLRSYHGPTDVAIITGICIDTRPSDQHLCLSCFANNTWEVLVGASSVGTSLQLAIDLCCVSIVKDE